MCDSVWCDLEAIGVPSIFKLIRKAVALARMLPTLALNCLFCLFPAEYTCNAVIPVHARSSLSYSSLETQPNLNVKKHSLLYVNLRAFFLRFCFFRNRDSLSSVRDEIDIACPFEYFSEMCVCACTRRTSLLHDSAGSHSRTSVCTHNCTHNAEPK